MPALTLSVPHQLCWAPLRKRTDLPSSQNAPSTKLIRLERLLRSEVKPTASSLVGRCGPVHVVGPCTSVGGKHGEWHWSDAPFTFEAAPSAAAHHSGCGMASRHGSFSATLRRHQIRVACRRDPSPTPLAAVVWDTSASFACLARTERKHCGQRRCGAPRRGRPGGTRARATDR